MAPQKRQGHGLFGSVYYHIITIIIITIITIIIIYIAYIYIAYNIIAYSIIIIICHIIIIIIFTKAQPRLPAELPASLGATRSLLVPRQMAVEISAGLTPWLFLGG